MQLKINLTLVVQLCENNIIFLNIFVFKCGDELQMSFELTTIHDIFEKNQLYDNDDILHNMNRIAKIGMDFPQK